jgi:hypothetical protein
MKGIVLVGLVALMVFSLVTFAFCGENDLPKEKVIAIATAAAKEAGVVAEEADIIYDEGGKLWDEKTGFLVGEDKSPNHGILRKGFLKNYKIVYFDFKEPVKDVWVFVDKDTGDVLTVYKEE